MKSYNRELLSLARRARGMSQAQLARVAGINQGHLSKVESGLNEFSVEHWKRIARALDLPESFFRQNVRILGLPMSIHPMHRKKADVGLRSLDQIEAELNIRLWHLKTFLQSMDVELVPQFPLPKFDIDAFNGDIEEIAQAVRRTWLLPRGPIENLIACIEAAGCVVQWCDFAGTTIWGASLSVPGLPPCIFLNPTQPSDRQRFTLSHELAHLVMHEIPDPHMEKQADAFAGALLMPASDIRGALSGRLTLARLATFKRIWRVSMQAYLYRAKEIGAISSYQSDGLWKELSASGFRKREPAQLDFPREEPRLLAHVLNVQLQEYDYTTNELAKAVHMKENEFCRIYGLTAQQDGTRHLTLVP